MMAFLLSTSLVQAEEPSDAYDDETSQDEELGDEDDADPKRNKPLKAGGLEAPDAMPENPARPARAADIRGNRP